MNPTTSEATPVQHPLTCVMTIKSEADHQALRALIPQAHIKIVEALNKIGTVHFARFVFLANNTQLAIITEYDGDFDTYISDFAAHVGDVFDAILPHIKDAPPLPVRKNTAAFIDFIRRNDVAVERFYSAYPERTVVQITHP